MDEDLKMGLLICSLFLISIGALVGHSLNRAEKEAEIYNNTYGTHYKPSDFFFAGNTIKEKIHGGDQKTFNLNAKLAHPEELEKKDEGDHIGDVNKMVGKEAHK